MRRRCRFRADLRQYGLEREKLTSYATMFEARYKSITQLIRQSGASQVLDLATGYSFRGFDLARGDSLRYVETDPPDVVTAKLSIASTKLTERFGLKFARELGTRSHGAPCASSSRSTGGR